MPNDDNTLASQPAPPDPDRRGVTRDSEAPAPKVARPLGPPSVDAPTIAPSRTDASAAKSPTLDPGLRTGELPIGQPNEWLDDDFSIALGAVPNVAGAESLTGTVNFDGATTRIGRYEIHRVLGEGAFGRVYEARDPQLDRVVAIKVAKSLDASSGSERFLREARLAAQLRHPHIIPVHEYGQVGDKHIIVYEFIAGESLKSYLNRNQPLPINDALRLTQLIAEGLDYAHSKGIIHRDMKPDNVMIDAHGQPHIADFGCARSVDADVSLTVDGSILGTPTYMSPEQASGHANVADGRSDIWSLGVMLYEMVGGQKPFSGKLNEVLNWIRNYDPPSLRKLKPSVSLDIETITNKCLRREPEDRFATAAELADEIERFQRGEPIHSRRVSLGRRLVLWRQRNKMVANLLGVIALTLVAGIASSGFYAWQAWQERAHRFNTQLASIQTAAAAELPAVFESLETFGDPVLLKLEEQIDAAKDDPALQRRLRTAVLHLTPDPNTKSRLSSELLPGLLDAPAGDVANARAVLVDPDGVRADTLWKVTLNSDGQETAARRLRAAALLARLDADSEDWPSVSSDLSGILVNMNLLESTKWLELLKPVRSTLCPALEQAFHRADATDPEHPTRAASMLATLYGDDPAALVELIPAASAKQLAWLLEPFEQHATDARHLLEQRLTDLLLADKQSATAKTLVSTAGVLPVSYRQRELAQANLVIGLIRLGSENHWSFLDRRQHPAVATEIIERLGPPTGITATPVEELVSQLRSWQQADAQVLSSLMLAMGQFSAAQVPSTRRQLLRPLLIDVFHQHPDAGTHSAARWLLQHWGWTDQIVSAELTLRRRDPEPGKRWHVDLDGNTFAIFDAVDQFEMGTADLQSERLKSQGGDPFDETAHLRSIPRRFGICIHEVTIEQYARFEKYQSQQWQVQRDSLDEASTAPDVRKQRLRYKSLLKGIARRQKNYRPELLNTPVTDIDFYQALKYCRWLSDEAKLLACFGTLNEIQRQYELGDGDGREITRKHVQRPGYRLPTAAEWEYACRAGTTTLRPLGDSPARLDACGWFGGSQRDSLQQIASLKPSSAGMFDMLGNASEWCLTWYREVPPALESAEDGESSSVRPDIGDFENLQRGNTREYRGGSYVDIAVDVRSSKRFHVSPSHGLPYLGFRLARTYPAQSADAP